MNDEELMQRYQQGDFAAFEVLYRRFAPRLFGYVRKKEFKRESQEEIFQNVLLKLHRTRESYDPKFPFLAWLFTIAHSVLVDHLRSSARRPQGEELREERQIPAAAPSEPAREIPWEQLNPKDRDLLEGRYLKEETFGEIAQRLHLTEAGARKRVSRVLQGLKKKMTGAQT